MVKTSIYYTEKGKNQVLSFYDNLLTQWPQPSKSQTIETTYGKTFLIESGISNTKSVLLLHGSSSNSSMWLAVVKELSKSYHVYAIDIIGECGKSSENRPSFKTNSYSDWLLQIITKLNLNKVSLVGCSLGGWIAIDFATKNPDKTEKLILLATAGIVQVKAKTIIWIIITSFLGHWGFSKLNKLVYGNIEIDQRALEFASLIKQHYKPRTDVLPVFTNSILQKIYANTLFIGGENDCFYNSHKTSKRLKENLANIQCLLIENNGHVLINQTNNIKWFLNN